MEIDGGRDKGKNGFIMIAQNTRGADVVHRLALAFLRVGNFLTGRCPGSGAACDGGAPIVKIVPLLPGVCI